MGPAGRSRTAALAAVCTVLSVAPAASAETLDPVAPATAAAFRDSVGVTTHPFYFNTPYGDWDRVLARTAELGVRHIRGDVQARPESAFNQRLRAVLDATVRAGIGLHVVLAQDCNGDGPVDACLDVVRRLPAGSVEHLEWPPELDLRGGPDWPSLLQARGRDMYTKVKADPELRGIPVVGPALKYDDSFVRLGDQSAFLDFGNMQPFTGALSPNPKHLAVERRKVAPASGTKPVLATGGGFHVGPQGAPDDHPPTDERSAAVYTVRTVLEHFASGVPRTYLYELVDVSFGAEAQSYFGLLRGDFSPRPAYTALKNLLAMVGSSAPATSPLLYAVTGDTADLRQLVLQQADGTYLLVLWRTASVWDRDARRDLDVSPKPYVVDAPDALSVARGNPHFGTDFAPVTNDEGRIAVNVGAHPAVLRITTGGSGVAGAGSGAGSDRDRTAPRIRQIRLTKLKNGRWAARFALSETATVRARMDRGRPSSSRYRLLRRVRGRPLRDGRRSFTVGTLKRGRHKLLLSAKDVAGNQRHVLYRFKVGSKKRR
jgi:hypothetical protein